MAVVPISTTQFSKLTITVHPFHTHHFLVAQILPPIFPSSE